MSRRRRQRDELLLLCRSGAVGRAVDLAFAHFAEFGCDDDVLAALTDAVGRTAAPAPVRRRFDELRARHR